MVEVAPGGIDMSADAQNITDADIVVDAPGRTIKGVIPWTEQTNKQ